MCLMKWLVFVHFFLFVFDVLIFLSLELKFMRDEGSLRFGFCKLQELVGWSAK